jgi:hypothetical protein
VKPSEQEITAVMEGPEIVDWAIDADPHHIRWERFSLKFSNGTVISFRPGPRARWLEVRIER